jgi:hypothetical protein
MSWSRQYQGVFRTIFKGQVTADITSAATGSGTFGSVTVTVPGVALGDFVEIAPVSAATTAGSPVFAEASAANTVRIYTLNNSAGTVDYASQVFNLVVRRVIL